MIATIRILNMYYYIVLKWSNVRVSVLEKKIRKRHQVRYRYCFNKNVGMKKLSKTDAFCVSFNCYIVQKSQNLFMYRNLFKMSAGI